MNTPSCPVCESNSVHKAGRTRFGSQQWRCKACKRRFTPEPKAQGHPDPLRQQAVKLYADGMSLRQIARHLGVAHRSVGLWVQAHAAQLPPADQPPQPIAVIEQDELFTFVGSKKTSST
jgi:transposase-like protein